MTDQLSDLTRAELDPQLLDALLDDLTRHTQIMEVTVKGGEFSRAEKAPVSLQEAIEALRGGRIRGVQVRYRWQGEEWLDTLLANAGQFRIVRLKVPPD